MFLNFSFILQPILTNQKSSSRNALLDKLLIKFDDLHLVLRVRESFFGKIGTNSVSLKNSAKSENTTKTVTTHRPLKK